MIFLECITRIKSNQTRFFRKMSFENRLLLFLMKMKLGLDHSALSCIFRISRTASKIFYDMLHLVFENTKTWILWPSREAIKETLPPCFKNYPNCRVIIDCTELHCDSPPKVEQ